jgi:hypothetical protein
VSSASIAAGYLIYSGGWEVSNENPIILVERGTNSNTTSLPLLDISDWKTYSNKVYKFSIQYPKDWEYRSISDTFVRFLSSSKDFNNPYSLGNVEVEIKENPRQLSSKDYFNGRNYADLYSDARTGIEDITINGVFGTRFNGVIGMVTSDVVVIRTEDTFYILSLLKHSTTGAEESAEEQMLQSFTFY